MGWLTAGGAGLRRGVSFEGEETRECWLLSSLYYIVWFFFVWLVGVGAVSGWIFVIFFRWFFCVVSPKL